MSSRKSQATENNENVCPVTRKRLKSSASTTRGTSNSPCKFAKFEASSPASTLSLEDLEEMGIGMLDSDGSSSSIASAVALAASAASFDENSNNELTPNADLAKIYHQRMPYRSIDSSLDNSNDITNGSFDATLQANGQNNNTFEVFGDDGPVIQQRKVAILGMGAGGHSSDSPSSSRSTRSPLAMVACNSQNRNSTQLQQLASSNDVTPQNVNRCISPSSQPSTSQQAALVKQQQQLQQLQVQQQYQQHLQQLQQQKQQQERFVQQDAPVAQDSFFLFRHPRPDATEAKDFFGMLSDEMILQIFKWLPKKALLRCSSVCRRFSSCATDESLWTRLDLSGRPLRPGALEQILNRGVVILRLSQAEIKHPAFSLSFLLAEPPFQSKLQYLDLSMATVTKHSLKSLLSFCRQLRKLSLEHVPINDEICNEIAMNTNLEALNLTMCTGLEAWSVRKMMDALKNLNSLNISWTNLSVDAVTSLVTNVTPNLMRLNVAGCRKTMFDSHVSSLVKRCTQLLELDLSDCTGLTSNAVNHICEFKMLEYLSLSRCYLIPASAYIELAVLPTLTYLDVFGMLSDQALEMLERNFPNLGINKFIHSSVARPTVGTRRTSIWGLRTRD